MIETLRQADPAVALPEGFKFNPDILADRDEQILMFLSNAAYQAAPIPSFEGVPTVAIEPAFNPSNAPDEEIYGHVRAPDSTPEQPIEMWRIVDRDRLRDGSALVSSRILGSNSVGDVEAFEGEMIKHLASNHDSRMSDPEAATPYLSFSTDPLNLANRMILGYGFGIKDGRDSVVVRVRVDPSRVRMSGQKKQPEVLLLGGVAPEEYVDAYEVADFVSTLLPNGSSIRLPDNRRVSSAEATEHWGGPSL